MEPRTTKRRKKKKKELSLTAKQNFKNRNILFGSFLWLHRNGLLVILIKLLVVIFIGCSRNQKCSFYVTVILLSHKSEKYNTFITHTSVSVAICIYSVFGYFPVLLPAYCMNLVLDNFCTLVTPCVSLPLFALERYRLPCGPINMYRQCFTVKETRCERTFLRVEDESECSTFLKS